MQDRVGLYLFRVDGIALFESLVSLFQQVLRQMFHLFVFSSCAVFVVDIGAYDGNRENDGDSDFYDA